MTCRRPSDQQSRPGRHLTLALVATILLASTTTGRGEINTWTKVYNSPGRLTSVVVDPLAPTTTLHVAGLLQYSPTTGLFCRSTNAGGSFTCSTVIGWYPSSLAVNRQNPSRMLAGGFLFPAAPDNYELYYSTTGGSSWTACTKPAGFGGQIVSLQWVDADNAVAGTDSHGLWSVNTSSGCAVGTMAAPIGTPGFVYDIESYPPTALVPTILWAGTTVGVYKKAPSLGVPDWTPFNTGLPANSNVVNVATDPATSNTVYATLASVGPDGLFKTTNGGSAWIDKTAALPFTFEFEVDPLTPSRLYAAAGSSGISRSTDGGDTWVQDGSGLVPGYTIDGLGAAPTTPRTLYVTQAAQGIYKNQLCTTVADCTDAYACTADACNPASASASIAGCTHTPSTDTDREGIPDCADNCPSTVNQDQNNLDGDGPAVGDVCDACPGCIGASCCVPTRTTSATVGFFGPSLQTPDGSVTLVPPGFSPPRSVSITGVNQSAFGIGNTATNQVIVARFGPAGPLPGPATVTFTWPDSAAPIGTVDGTSILEVNLKLFHCPTPGTCQALGTCQAQPSTTCECGATQGSCPSSVCPSGGTCVVNRCAVQGCPAGSASCCDPTANTWRFSVNAFSELALGLEPCLAVGSPKLMLKKIGAPTGDDGLMFRGLLSLPPGTTAADADPITHGLQFVLGDAPGATTGIVADAFLAPGAYDPVTEVGWSLNRTGTKWTYVNRGPTPPAGIVRATLQDRSSKAPGLVAISVKGEHGAFAATAAVTASVVLPDLGQCYSASFPGPSPNGCRLNPPATTLNCRSAVPPGMATTTSTLPGP
jgi:hypothetical protein